MQTPSPMQNAGSAWYLPHLATTLVLAGCMTLAFFFESDFRERHESQLQTRCENSLLRQASELRAGVMTRSYLLRPLDALVATTPALSQEQFVPFASQALLRFPQLGVLSLQLARDGDVSHYVPLEHFAEHFGRELDSELVQSVSAGRGFVMQSPTRNSADRLVSYVHTPIYLSEEGSDQQPLWGIGSVEIDLGSVLAEIRGRADARGEPNLEYSLRGSLNKRTGDNPVFHGQADLFDEAYSTVSVSLPGQRWELAMGRPNSDPDTSIILLLRLNGILISGLLARLTWKSMKQRRILTQQVESSKDALTLSRRRLSLIMDAMPVGLFETDASGECTYVNPRWCELTGLSLQEALGAGWRRAIHGDDLSTVVAAWIQFVEGDQDFSECFRYHTPAGAVHWIECTSTRIVDSTGTVIGYVGASLDVTARRAAEQDRARLEAQNLHSQKLESLGVLAGGIAHDFNNLLMGITGHSELMLSDLPPNSPARSHVEEISLTAKRAGDLCTQMLNYAGRGSVTMTTLDLNALVTEIPHLLGLSVGKSVELKYELREDLGPIQGDSSQLRQVLMNLVINAAESISESTDERPGQVILRTGTRELSPKHLLELHYDGGLAPGPVHYMEVADNGQGMDPEVIRRIFEPFFTTKVSGRGLGMAAVLGIVGKHGGGISLNSSLGEGTTFTIFIPTSAEAQTQASPANEPSSEVAWKGEGTVLLIDDEELVRRPTQRLLEHIGFQVVAAASGEEGLELLNSKPDGFALILLDLTMPGIGGEEAFRRIRSQSPTQRVALVSGYSAGGWIERETNDAWTTFIAKPFGMGQLKASLQDLMRAGPAQETV